MCIVLYDALFAVVSVCATMEWCAVVTCCPSRHAPAGCGMLATVVLVGGVCLPLVCGTCLPLAYVVLSYVWFQWLCVMRPSYGVSPNHPPRVEIPVCVAPRFAAVPP